MKICSKCHVKKPESEFFIRDKKSGRLHAQCKACYTLHRQTYHSEHYQKYGDMYRVRAKIRRSLIKKTLQKNMSAYLRDKTCQLCGENDPRTLDFDHIDPHKKSFGIAKGVTNGLAWELILAEIEKCRILCANCHRKHTATQQSWYRGLGLN